MPVELVKKTVYFVVPDSADKGFDLYHHFCPQCPLKGRVCSGIDPFAGSAHLQEEKESYLREM